MYSVYVISIFYNEIYYKSNEFDGNIYRNTDVLEDDSMKLESWSFFYPINKHFVHGLSAII